MKRFITFAIAIIIAISVVSGCEKKTEIDKLVDKIVQLSEKDELKWKKVDVDYAFTTEFDKDSLWFMILISKTKEGGTDFVISIKNITNPDDPQIGLLYAAQGLKSIEKLLKLLESKYGPLSEHTGMGSDVLKTFYNALNEMDKK